MVYEIINRYGKVIKAYLVGPAYDIRYMYLIFERGDCFKIGLKGFFYLNVSTEPNFWAEDAIQLAKPEHAYLKLIYCDYVDPNDKASVVKASNSTLQATLDILLESV
jgi:hypothetical protein